MAAAGTARLRIDRLLVDRGLFESRAAAQAAIMAGAVRAAGQPVSRPSMLVDAGCAIEARPAHPYVSRGGVKLAHALDAFAIGVAGRDALDVGASTGGFTDVLLARGARHVDAVDTGRAQMHPRLRKDARVRLFEARDIRTIDRQEIEPMIDLAVIDVSFISLGAVLPAVGALLSRPADIVALVKPQFEVGRAAIGKGGIVRDPQARRDAVARVATRFAELDLVTETPIPSPIPGGDGNEEWFIHARARRQP